MNCSIEDIQYQSQLIDIFYPKLL